MNDSTDLSMMHSDVAAYCVTLVCDQEEVKCSNGDSVMDHVIGMATRDKAILDAQSLYQLQTDLPETSQKRFIFVDYSEGKSSMYFHPSILKDLSVGRLAEDMAAISQGNILLDFHPMTNMVILNELQRDISLENEMEFSAYERATTLAFAALYDMLNSRERLMFLNELQSNPDSLVPSIKAEAQWSGKFLWESNDSNKSDVSNSSLLNHTDDLEAFLSSDDEESTGEEWLSSDDDASTGQSPGDNIWVSDCHSPVKENDKASAVGHDQKKECKFQDFEGESTVLSFTAVESDPHFSLDDQVSLSDLSSFPASGSTECSELPEEAISPSTFQQGKQSVGVSSSSSGFSSSSSAIKRKHSVYSLPLQSGSAKKSGNEHIMQKVRLLRNVIPGVGDHMDTAAVVEEAICYLTSLQQKVQELEGCKQFVANRMG